MEEFVDLVTEPSNQLSLVSLEETGCWLNGNNNNNKNNNSKRSLEEDVYEDLCYVTLRSSQTDNGAIAGTPGCIVGVEPIHKRDYCIKELVETEKNYCEALHMIIDQFQEPLSNVLSMDQHQIVFGNLNSILALHNKLYEQLTSTTNNNTISNTNGTNGTNTNPFKMAPMVRPWLPLTTNVQHLSECFLQVRQQMLIYGQYCSNLPKAQQLLDNLCSQDPMIRMAVSKCQDKANEGRFKLRDLLSLPMQRILKYHLLLGELIKNCTTNVDHHNPHGASATALTEEQYSSISALKEAHEAMLDIGAYINEVKRDTETLEIIREIQRSIVDLSVPDNYELKDYGRLIKDGEVKVKSIDDGRMRIKNRYIFIFDKVLLMCKQLRGLQYSYKEAIMLEEYRLEDLPIGYNSTISKFTKQWSAGWSLVHVDPNSKSSVYNFYVKHEELKPKWIEAIERAQLNVHPKELSNTNHQFHMHTVPMGTCCASCGKLLKGTWYQGYLCCVCSISVHKECINSVHSCGVAANTTGGSVGEQNQANTNADGIGTRNIWPPTPSRAKRIICKANQTNNIPGQLAFEMEDVILVYANQGPCWYGRNIRTAQEGTFNSSAVAELITDSPASSSNLDSPTCAQQTSLRFNYDLDQLENGPLNVPCSPLAASSPCLPNIGTGTNVEMFFSTATNATNSKQSTSATSLDDQLRLFHGNGYNLEEYAWFAGKMDRPTAETTLSPLPNGSYLVRISPRQKNNYAISLNYKGLVKHMRIQVANQIDKKPTIMSSLMGPSDSPLSPPLNSEPTYFYLSHQRYFLTIVDLVRWYERNSLCESFNMVETQLLLAYKKAYCPEVLGYCVALYAFTGSSSAASSFLSLRKGDQIMVLSRAAQYKGWWKGQIGDRIGYFPFKYVSVNSDSLKLDPQQQQQQQPQQLNHQQQPPPSQIQQCDPNRSVTMIIDSNKMSPASSSTKSNSSTSSARTMSSPVNSDSDVAVVTTTDQIN